MWTIGVRPDVLQKLFLRDDASKILCQINKQPEFHFFQFDRLSAYGYLVGGEVDLDIGDPQGNGFHGPCTPL